MTKWFLIAFSQGKLEEISIRAIHFGKLHLHLLTVLVTFYSVATWWREETERKTVEKK